jgi:hypothetical protein
MSPKAPKGKISISGPFDARHVSGVNILGVTNPVAELQRSNTTAFSIQPDSIPTHSFAATGTEEVTKPKRANTIAYSLSRPSLKLKTSISRLRARSHSNSLDTHRKREETVESVPEAEEDKENAQSVMSTASLRQKPSTSRLRERAREIPIEQARRQKSSFPDVVMSVMAAPLEKPVLVVREKQLPPLKLREREGKVVVKTTMVELPDHSHRNLPQAQQQPEPRPQPQSRSWSQSRPQPRVQLQQPAPPPKPVQAKAQIVTRPKRADSGTALDFCDTLAQSRPLGFKEILAVNSLEQRMALYKKTREYWATVDHGLDEWVARAGTGPRRPVYSHA